MTKPLEPRYKFTNLERRPKYGINDYPPVGRWSDPRTPVLCCSGWHVPTSEGLALWINAELWEVRVKGRHVSDDNKESWEYIRFVKKITAWNQDGMMAFIKFCRPKNWQWYSDAGVGVVVAAAASAGGYGDGARRSQSNWIFENIINAEGGK